MDAVVMPPLQQTPTAIEIKNLVEKAEKRGTPGKHETVEINGLAVAEVVLYKVAQESKSSGHFAHKHDEGYARLTQSYKCLKCGVEVSRKDMVSVTGREDKESPFWADAAPKGERETKQSGLVVFGKYDGVLESDNVFQVFHIFPERYTAKKDAKKDARNLNAVSSICFNSDMGNHRGATQGYGLICEYQSRPAVWAGSKLFVLYREKEYNNIPEVFKYAEVQEDGIVLALTSLKPKMPQQMAAYVKEDLV